MSGHHSIISRVYRSLPLWLAQEYLYELGGRARDAEWIQGENWRVLIRDAPEIVSGAVHIGQTQMVFEGDAETVARLLGAFEKKALRAGG